MKPRTVFDRNPNLKQPPGRAGWATSFAPVLADLRATLLARDPDQVAACAAVTWSADRREFTLKLLDQRCRLGWPDLVAYADGADEPLGTTLQGLLLYYLTLADGSAPAERWIAFRELPDGWLYHQAFQGYSGDVLARELGNDADTFVAAAAALGGVPLDLGDRAYGFTALPRVKLAVVYWLGDDEFAPRAQVLFDAAAGHYLTTDGLAGLGSHLIARLLASRGVS
jgi:hypothetical protein